MSSSHPPTPPPAALGAPAPAALPATGTVHRHKQASGCLYLKTPFLSLIRKTFTQPRSILPGTRTWDAREKM